MVFTSKETSRGIPYKARMLKDDMVPMDLGGRYQARVTQEAYLSANGLLRCPTAVANGFPVFINGPQDNRSYWWTNDIEEGETVDVIPISATIYRKELTVISMLTDDAKTTQIDGRRHVSAQPEEQEDMSMRKIAQKLSRIRRIPASQTDVIQVV
jgi:hypothetical protein